MLLLYIHAKTLFLHFDMVSGLHRVYFVYLVCHNRFIFLNIIYVVALACFR